MLDMMYTLYLHVCIRCVGCDVYVIFICVYTLYWVRHIRYTCICVYGVLDKAYTLYLHMCIRCAG